MFKKEVFWGLNATFRNLFLLLYAGSTHKLTWLPRQLPEGLRVVVSTLEGECLDSLRNHANPAQEVAVNPLNEVTRKDMVGQLLQIYNKRLDAEQVGPGFMVICC